LAVHSFYGQCSGNERKNEALSRAAAKLALVLAAAFVFKLKRDHPAGSARMHKRE
jgi:hypothetical protein